MTRAPVPSFLRRRVPSLVGDQSKALPGSICWVAAAQAGGVGVRGAAVVVVLCACVHAFWSLGSLLDGARMIAAAGTGAVIACASVLIAQGVVGEISPPLAAVGVLMQMAPAWSQPADPFDSVTR